MDAVSGSDGAIASKCAAANGRDLFISTASGTILPPQGWFMRIAHRLWGGGENSPAKWLRSLTGFPERTCRSYARGDSSPSGEIFYALLRGEQGYRVLVAVMDGSTAHWWAELQYQQRVGAAAIAEIEKRD